MPLVEVSAPDTAEGAYSDPPDHLAGFGGPLQWGEGKERKRGMKGKGKAEEVEKV